MVATLGYGGNLARCSVMRTAYFPHKVGLLPDVMVSAGRRSAAIDFEERQYRDSAP